jgi:hypothetical protein
VHYFFQEYATTVTTMLSAFLLVALFVCHIFAIALPTDNAAMLAAVDDPMITPSPSIPSLQEWAVHTQSKKFSESAKLTHSRLAEISISISSLFNLLQPPATISSELTAFLTAVLTALEGPNVISAFDELYTDKGITWFTALPSAAESWVVGLPVQAATILPQIISLQSLANAVYTSSSAPTTPNDFFPTTTSTVTSTSGTQGNRRITEGQQIGTVIGSAAFLALAITLGVLIYDARKKRIIGNAMRPNVAAKKASHPPMLSLVHMRRCRQGQAAASGTAELGTDGTVQNHSASHGVQQQQEAYELHSPEIGHSAWIEWIWQVKPRCLCSWMRFCQRTDHVHVHSHPKSLS